jgi:hypothetical protein
MSKVGRVLAAALMSAATALPLSAADTTVTGELVEVSCYLKDKVKNVGVTHQDCATQCAMKGLPVAVLTDKGELYTVAGDLTKDNNALLAPHMSHRVVVIGAVTEKDGRKIITATNLKMAGPRF